MLPSTKAEIRVLVVEDNDGDFFLTRNAVNTYNGSRGEQEPFLTLSRVATFGACVDLLSREQFDVALLDLTLPDARGLDTFFSLRAIAPKLPTVILSGLDDTQLALSAVRAGAQDFLVKGKFQTELLFRSVVYAINRQQILAELELANDAAVAANRTAQDVLLPANAKILEALKEISALLQMPTGDGQPTFSVAHQTKAFAEARRLALAAKQTSDAVNEYLTIFSTSVTDQSREFDLCALLRSLSEPIRSTGRTEIELNIEDGLPIVVFGDAVKLERLLRCLIGELLSFNRGEGALKITVTGRADEQQKIQCLISLSAPDGVTVVFQERQAIFECLAQGGSAAAKKYGEKGMRLAVCSMLATMLGARVWFDLDYQTGPSFHVSAAFEFAKETHRLSVC